MRVARHCSRRVRNFTINNMLPGQFDTDRLRSNHEKFASRTGANVEEFRERMRNDVPAKRFGSAEEFGAVCAFLTAGTPATSPAPICCSTAASTAV